MKKKDFITQNKKVFKKWVKNPPAHISVEKMEKGHIPVVIPYLEKQKLNNPKNILDIGCGSGFVLEWFSKKFPDASVVGVDLTEEMVELSKKRTNLLSNVSVFQGEFCDFATHTDIHFDYIFSNETFYYIPETDTAIECLQKRLTSDGNASILIDYFREHKESAAWEQLCGIKAHYLSQKTWHDKFKVSFPHVKTSSINNAKTLVIAVSKSQSPL